MFPIMILGLIQQSLNPRLGEAPSARIERLFLTPDDCLGVGVHVEVFLEWLPGEGVELLDSCDGCVDMVVFGTVLV